MSQHREHRRRDTLIISAAIIGTLAYAAVKASKHKKALDAEAEEHRLERSYWRSRQRSREHRDRSRESRERQRTAWYEDRDQEQLNALFSPYRQPRLALTMPLLLDAPADHRKRWTSNQSGCPLFRLPPEVRNVIYGLVFTDGYVHIYPSQGRKHAPLGSKICRRSRELSPCWPSRLAPRHGLTTDWAREQCFERSSARPSDINLALTCRRL